MLTARLLFILTVLICSVLSAMFSEEKDSGETTIKKRRGRPKKIQTTTIKILKQTTKKVTESPWTILPRNLIDPLRMTTKVGINEYETYFDDSGWWHDAIKKYANATTKKRRLFPTTTDPPTTVYDELEHYSPPPNTTSRLAAMYYSMKQYYMKPENRKKADHLVRNIIDEHDRKKGISPMYTWHSIEDRNLGRFKHDYLTNYEELRDLSF